MPRAARPDSPHAPLAAPPPPVPQRCVRATPPHTHASLALTTRRPSRRPHTLSACFFALGFGTLLPWSTCVVTLPWLAAASRRAPAPPQALADSLLGALTLTFSLSNALTVLAIARLDLARTLPPAWQVPRPLVACAALQGGAAYAALRDARGDPFGGAVLVAIALPLALAQGVLTAFINCGAAAEAAPRPARVMRAYTSGQALAGACPSFADVTTTHKRTHKR
jgi:hypothetical protein